MAQDNYKIKTKTEGKIIEICLGGHGQIEVGLYLYYKSIIDLISNKLIHCPSYGHWCQNNQAFEEKVIVEERLLLIKIFIYSSAEHTSCLSSSFYLDF